MNNKKCAGTVWSGVWPSGYPCGNKASLEHDGKWWCKIHHPPTVEAKAKEKHRAQEAAYEARLAQRRRDQIELALKSWALDWVRDNHPAVAREMEKKFQEKIT